MHDKNAQAFVIDSNIFSNMNVIYERAYFSCEFFCMLAFVHSVFPRTIVLKHMINCQDSFKFDILYCYC